MFRMVDYGRQMSVKKSCMANMDHLSICSSCPEHTVDGGSGVYDDLSGGVELPTPSLISYCKPMLYQQSD